MKRRSQPKAKRQKATPYWKKVQLGQMMYGPNPHSSVRGMRVSEATRALMRESAVFQIMVD